MISPMIRNLDKVKKVHVPAILWSTVRAMQINVGPLCVHNVYDMELRCFDTDLSCNSIPSFLED